MANEPVLHIICPPQRRLPPVILFGLVALILLSAVYGNIQSILAGEKYSLLLVALVIFAAGAVIVYRNLFFQDQIYFLAPSASPPGPFPSINAADVISVRRLPAPDAFSVEGKMLWLGLGQGRIEIETSDDRFSFGVGLDEFVVDETIHRIIDFCSAQRKLHASDKSSA